MATILLRPGQVSQVAAVDRGHGQHCGDERPGGEHGPGPVSVEITEAYWLKPDVAQ